MGAAPLPQALSVKSAANLVTLHDHYVMVPEAIAAMEEREAALDHLFSLQVRVCGGWGACVWGDRQRRCPGHIMSRGSVNRVF